MRSCQTYMWVELPESGIVFDDCLVGNTYFKDFTIWNRSEIELFWHIDVITSMGTNENFLYFTDCNTSEVFDGSPIPAYSHRRIRLSLETRVVGDLIYEAEISNLNDSQNCIRFPIYVNIRKALSEQLLLFPMGRLLDFGDCCGGNIAYIQLISRNLDKANNDYQEYLRLDC